MTSILSNRAFSGLFALSLMLPLSIGVLGLTMFRPAIAQERSVRTLTVTGQGEEMIQTTLAQISLGVEVQADTAVEAQQEAAQRSSDVVDFLRSRNVSKLETTGINLNPRYNYANNEQQLIGYTASNTVSFQVPTDEAGSLIDEAVRTGATQISGVSFVAEDEAIADAESVALREATEEAQRQADVVLQALGLSRQEVIGVQINGASSPTPPPIPYRAALADAAEAASSPVIGGEQAVTASVTLEIRY